MTYFAIDGDGERVPLTENDMAYIAEVTKDGSKPMVQLDSGEMLNLAFNKKIVKGASDLPLHKGGDPSKAYMDKQKEKQL